TNKGKSPYQDAEAWQFGTWWCRPSINRRGLNNSQTAVKFLVKTMEPPLFLLLFIIFQDIPLDKFQKLSMVGQIRVPTRVLSTRGVICGLGQRGLRRPMRHLVCTICKLGPTRTG
ncbi:uncharacterized protein PgNI_11583, partial [Pyricularia grisea]|uniref:Uncharacterized protein n=1 Tax=Pyricularia grisea TaxID=148305 RepID=A0A6P8ANJ6_PYRGI